MNEIISTSIDLAISELKSNKLSCSYIDFFHRYFKEKSLEKYFMHLGAFPTLELPIVANEELGGVMSKHDLIQLGKHSVFGYLSIRIMDDVMDAGGNCAAIEYLPLCHDLYYRFSSHYQSSAHFNELHERTIFETMKERQLGDISLDNFINSSSKKVALARLPLNIVLERGSRSGEFDRFFDLLSCAHQMQNDFFDWERDFRDHQSTHFISYLKAVGGVNYMNVIRHGLSYYKKTMSCWFKEMEMITSGTKFYALYKKKYDYYLAQIKKLEKGRQLLSSLIP